MEVIKVHTYRLLFLWRLPLNSPLWPFQVVTQLLLRIKTPFTGGTRCSFSSLENLMKVFWIISEMRKLKLFEDGNSCSLRVGVWRQEPKLSWFQNPEQNLVNRTLNRTLNRTDRFCFFRTSAWTDDSVSIGGLNGPWNSDWIPAPHRDPAQSQDTPTLMLIIQNPPAPEPSGPPASRLSLRAVTSRNIWKVLIRRAVRVQGRDAVCCWKQRNGQEEVRRPRPLQQANTQIRVKTVKNNKKQLNFSSF